MMSTRYAGMLFPGSHAPAATEPATLRSVGLNEASLTSGQPTSPPAKEFFKTDFGTRIVRDIKLANVLYPLDGCENKNVLMYLCYMI